MDFDGIELTEEQSTAALLIYDWFMNSRKPYFVLTGYAGTGKTFLVNYVIKMVLNIDINKVAFIAPTGKAAMVLLQRGNKGASTLHHLIYNIVENDKDDGKKKDDKKEFRFIKKPELSPKPKLIVLDEASMVDDKTFEDLCSFKVPILCLGDTGQLPPVMGNSKILEKPDAQLTEIMRQEKDDPIVSFATMARTGEPLPFGNYGSVEVYDRNYLTQDSLKEILMSADQILTGTNNSVSRLNKLYKGYLGMDPKNVNVGEKVICLQNNWEQYLDSDKQFSLVNGCVGTVVDYRVDNPDEKIGLMSFKPEFLTDITHNLAFDLGLFYVGKETYPDRQLVNIYKDDEGVRTAIYKSPKGIKDKKVASRIYMNNIEASAQKPLNLFRPAYAITVHKSQGSEWDTVVVIDQGDIFGSDASKWRYTAFTRARKKLIILR